MSDIRASKAHVGRRSAFSCAIGLLTGMILQSLCAPAALAQVFGIPINNAPGVYLDVDGKVRNREIDEKDQLAGMRARLKAGADAAKGEKLAYLSLPKLFAQVRALRQAGKEIPEELRCLGGMTQLRYVLVYPEEHDLIIAGPAEPWLVVHGQGDSTDFVIGKRTGHPVMQLDDLVVALRTAREGRGGLFGCGIYPSPDSMKIAHEISQRMAASSRAERLAALREGLGPQDVRIFGQRNDTRFAYICVAADYEMKRMALGVDHSPVASLGNAMDNTRSAANKFWFVADYEPLLVSKDGNAYQIRGQRLGLQCGAFDFAPGGATETAKRWTGKFAKNIPTLATAVPLYAELQNVADEAFLGNLLRRDRLAEKIDWDNAWIFDDATCPVAKVPTPKTCETLVSFTNGSMVAGGVVFVLDPCMEENTRQADDKGALDTTKQQLAKLKEGNDKAAVNDSGSIFRER